MPVIEVLEHERLPIRDERSRGSKALTTRQAALLQKVVQGLPAGAVEWGHQSVKFSHYCGVIQLEGDSIEILPKIYGKEDNPGSCRDILIKLLYAARRLKPSRGGQASIDLQRHHLLDVFIRSFCDELNQQLRQGMIRRYVTRVDNLTVLRGKLLIGQHLRMNASSQERVYCEYDELVEDNLYNQVIKFVLALLLKVARSGNTKRTLTGLLYRFEAVNDCPVSVDDLGRLLFDRGNARFKAIFEYCEWFIRGLSPDVVSGDRRCLSLLFDMNKLFEEFVARRLRPVAWGQGLRLREQGPQRRLLRQLDDGPELFVLKPDIALERPHEGVEAILDTKWKLLDDVDRKLGISQGDLYQMTSYAVRYGCNHVGLVYPATSGFGEPVAYEVQNSSIVIRVYFVDLEASVSDPNWPGWSDMAAWVE